jgi:hypothetical protein
MTDIAKHVRIFTSQPDDDFVKKRRHAVKEIEASLGKIVNTDEITKLANYLALALSDCKLLDESISTPVIKALRKASESFIPEEEELQIVVMASAAIIQQLESDSTRDTQVLTVVDVMALTLWSSLSFNTSQNEPKLFALCSEIVSISKKIIDDQSIASRTRLEIGSVEIEGEDLPTIKENLSSLLSSNIEVLSTNAMLDREELNILWWILNDWSTLANRNISSLNPAQRVIVSAIEISDLLNRIPAQSHYQMILRSCPCPEQKFTCAEIISELGELAGIIKNHFNGNQLVKDCSKVFPLLNAIMESDTDREDYVVKRPLKEWGGRALLEGTITNLNKFINAGH